MASLVIPEINTNNRQLVLSARVQVFPSLKIGVKDFEYTQENASVVKIKEVSAYLNFWQLFKGNLFVKKIVVRDGVVNLYELPSFYWREEATKTKTTEEPVGKKIQEVYEENTQGNLTDSFFKLDKIELTNIQLNYSKSPAYSPVYLNRITYNHSTEGKEQYFLTVKGEWENEPLNADVAANFSTGSNLINANFNFATNTVAFSTETADKNFRLRTHASINNSAIIARLLSLEPMQIPAIIDAVVSITNGQLSISPLHMIFSSGELKANLNHSPHSPVTIQMILPQKLLDNLSGTKIYDKCPLPWMVQVLVKGLKTELALAVSDPINNQPVQSFIYIDGVGIRFAGSELPAVLQKNMQTCFNFDLKDESIESTTTYSLESKSNQ